MSDYELEQERFYECVKNLDQKLHLGGVPARAVVVELVQGRFVIYKANLRPDKSFNLARSLAKNETRNWNKIHCVNQKTKTRVDTITNLRIANGN